MCRMFCGLNKKKKALIYKAFLMVAVIGFEPMTLREGLYYNKKREMRLWFLVVIRVS